MSFKLGLAMFLTIFFLFGFLFALLASVGYFFNISGYIIVLFAILLVILQWWISPKIIWWTTNMRLLEKNEYPWLRKIVKEICKKTNTPIPKIAIVRSGVPNAFVFGRTPKGAVLAVTTGLLKTLNKDEIKAVVAHEIGHINHKDMIVMTLVGSIPVIAYFIARFIIFTPRRDERRSGAAIIVGLMAFVVYFISNLLVLLLSRLREYYADRFSGIHTKPRYLISALIKITYGLSISSRELNESVRSFFIADPVGSKREVSKFSEEYKDLEIDEKEIKKAMEWEKRNPLIRFLEIFQTHPLTFKRIKALKELERKLREEKS